MTLNWLNADGTIIRHALTAGRLTIGRQGDLVLPHGSVSRQHAQIERRGDGWLLTDLGSRNGTYANGASIQRHFLRGGDVLKFGRMKVKVEVPEENMDDDPATGTLTQPMTETGTFAGDAATTALVGRSEALKNAMRLAIRAAKSDAPVIVYGESGTGKELFARLVYEESRRRKGRFLTVNCSAIEQSLIGSTLFGHEKGAFTGADRQKKGLFEEADGGTLFLDEIGDVSHDIQVKLLRVLQEGEFMRVGGTETIKVNVRVIAATNKDLKKAVAEGKFREDLYYRLNVIPINLPPLRERGDDVADLVRHFVSFMGGPTRSVSEEALAALSAYDWPGNVRQLRNMMERAVILSMNDELQLDDFPEEIRRAGTGESGCPKAPGLSCAPVPSGDGNLAEVEVAHIRSVLAACGGNKKLAAERLGISRSTLYEKLRETEACPNPGHGKSSSCPITGHGEP